MDVDLPGRIELIADLPGILLCIYFFILKYINIDHLKVMKIKHGTSLGTQHVRYSLHALQIKLFVFTTTTSQHP
jgi:hypothetical protein